VDISAPPLPLLSGALQRRLYCAVLEWTLPRVPHTAAWAHAGLCFNESRLYYLASLIGQVRSLHFAEGPVC
jgi:hypothetical protein